MNPSSGKMSGRVRELLATADLDISREAKATNATVQRNVRHRRRKSMPTLQTEKSSETVDGGTEGEPITDDWNELETVTFDGDDLCDAEGRLLQRHKHRHYRRLHRHQEGTMSSGNESGEDIDEDIYVTYPAGLDQQSNTEDNVVVNSYAYTIKVTHFHQLPTWLQDNDFLLTAHRLPLSTAWDCARSMFTIHSETGNIWTHLLGCVLFISMAVAFYVANKQETAEAKIVFGFFFAGAIGCLALSTAFHTMSCHHRLAHLFCKLDYVGISLLIVTSIIPWLYYGFYCRTAAKYIYMGICVAFGSVTVVVSLKDKFSTKEYRPLRALVFVLTAMSGILPMGHYWITDGYLAMSHQLSLGSMATMALMYIVGATLYALRIPERFMPGKCDLMFQSHQLFHLFVVAAAFMHYNGISEMAADRLRLNCCTEEVLHKKWADWLPIGDSSVQ